MRNFLYNIYFYFCCFLFSTVGQVSFYSPKASLYVSRLWALGTFWGFKVINKTKIIEIDLHNKPKDGEGCVVASKHQSALETIYYFIPFPKACFTPKKELSYIPLWGWYHRHNQNICIDREGGAKALKNLIKMADVRIKEGRQLILFPEGTRTKPLAENIKYHTSVYALYNKGHKVYPVALNTGVFWPKGSFKKYPGEVKIKYLPVMPEGLNKDEFMQLLTTRIETASRALAKEALLKMDN